MTNGLRENRHDCRLEPLRPILEIELTTLVGNVHSGPKSNSGRQKRSRCYELEVAHRFEPLGVRFAAMHEF